MKKITTFILLCFLLFSSCNNDDDTAPSISQENTFSCKINGELFVPEDYSSFPNSFTGISAHIIPENNWFFHLQNTQKNIYIYIVNVIETGEYMIYLSDGNGDFLGEETSGFDISITGNSTPSHHSIDNNDTVTVVELDINTRIVLEFDEITLVNNNDPSDIVKLTDGKLNINLETLNL